MPVVTKFSGAAILEIVEQQRTIYDGSEIDVRMQHIIRDTPHPTLSSWDIQRLLRASRAVYFDSHVQVVSGHHTEVYLRFESIARVPDLVTIIASNMAEWILQTFHHAPPAGILTTSSDARLLAERTCEILAARLRLRTVLTPFNSRHGQDRHGDQQWSDRTGRAVSFVKRRHHTRHVRQ